MPSGAERKDVPFQIRCAQSWLDRVQEAADALELSAAAYIRMVVTQRMDQDGVAKRDHSAPKKPRKPKPD
jgi:hypothetical protein